MKDKQDIIKLFRYPSIVTDMLKLPFPSHVIVKITLCSSIHTDTVISQSWNKKKVVEG